MVSIMSIHRPVLEFDPCILAILISGDQGFDLSTEVGVPGRVASEHRDAGLTRGSRLSLEDQGSARLSASKKA